MARRKKRQKPPNRTPQPGNSAGQSPMLALDKSLPSLPVDLAPPEHGSQANTPRQRPDYSRSNTSSSLPSNQLSPAGNQGSGGMLHLAL